MMKIRTETPRSLTIEMLATGNGVKEATEVPVDMEEMEEITLIIMTPDPAMIPEKTSQRRHTGPEAPLLPTDARSMRVVVIPTRG